MDGIEAVGALNVITEKIIGCAFRVSGELGSGFLEKVYENALASGPVHELPEGNGPEVVFAD